MAMFDVHSKGQTVVDGNRPPRFRADVWIKDGRVAQPQPGLSGAGR